MARRRAGAPVLPSNALVASAVRYPGKIERIYRGKTDWQIQAWRHYDICPELRFGANWIANALSRVKLFPATVDGENKTTPSDDAVIGTSLRRLFSGSDGQAQMLHALGLHLTVAGEAYLVGRTVSGADVWEIVGVREMRVSGSRWSIDYGAGMQPVQLADKDVVIRIWRPHPAARIEADSPVRALLPVLTEIEYLTRHTFAQTQSRLAGSGVFVLPQSVQFPPAPSEDGEEPLGSADSFQRVLGEAMTTPLKDPDNASAVVPIVITVPDDVVQHMKEPLHFWSPFDAQAVESRDTAIRRLALGMDLPPEVILGMTSGASSSGGVGTGASHWTAWQIEESAVKLHVEPLIELIINSIVITYLRPDTEVPNATIGYDSTALKLQPDRSREAMELLDRGELSGKAARFHSGFNEDDMPDDNERRIWLLRKIASGSATPEQVAVAAKALGVDLGQPTTIETPREARPAPSLDRHPLRPGPPEQRAALVAASEALVFRALERAGNRLRNGTVKKPPGVPAAETYLYVKSNGASGRLLEDAWACVPQVMQGLADPDKITPILDSYCHTLLDEQSPHSRERLERYLDLVETA